MSRRAAALILALAAAALASGCGEEGAASGATVRVYLSAPMRGEEAQAGRRLCEEAREQAAQRPGGEDLEVRVVCLDAAGPNGRWTLAQVGDNARRATEDSTAIAYVGEPDPLARRQSRPVLEAAGIASLAGLSGREAMAKVEAAIEEGDTSDPRVAVFDALG